MEEKIHFYYTNDLHSHFDNWSKVATYFKHLKTFHQSKKSPCYFVDIGDHLDRVHPVTEATMGRANVDMINAIGFDVVTLGNNEGITLSYEDLYHLYDHANFQVVCSNLNSLVHENPAWLEKSTIIETDSGVKIGVIGLTAAFNPYYNLLGWHASSPFETLEQYVTPLKDETDIIILLSHLGISEDRHIARHFPDIDIIIGGHTHHLLRTGEVVHETLLTAAGKFCSHVGEVILTWDHDLQKLVSKEAYAVNIDHLRKDPAMEGKIQKYDAEVKEALGQPIITINQPIEVNWFKETKIIRKLTDFVKEWTNADVGMLNAGLLLAGFTSGDITYQDVHRNCPHPINACVVSLKGSELLEVVRASFTRELMELQLKGFGFRGEKIGRMVFSGLDVDTDFHSNGHEYVKQVNFQGTPLEQNRTYLLATADMFTFGRLLPEIARAETKILYLPEFLRELLVMTLKDNFSNH